MLIWGAKRSLLHHNRQAQHTRFFVTPPRSQKACKNWGTNHKPEFHHCIQSWPCAQNTQFNHWFLLSAKTLFREISHSHLIQFEMKSYQQKQMFTENLFCSVDIKYQFKGLHNDVSGHQ